MGIEPIGDTLLIKALGQIRYPSAIAVRNFVVHGAIYGKVGALMSFNLGFRPIVREMIAAQ